MTWKDSDFKDSDFIARAWCIVRNYYSSDKSHARDIERVLKEAYNAGKKAGILSAEIRLKP